MKLSYPTRSKFLAPCEDVIQNHLGALLNGETLSVHLSEQGYNRDVQVTTFPSDPRHFHSNWIGTDPTRFSARIRATALALFNQGCFGTFRVIHQDGLLTIEMISSTLALYKKVSKSQYTDGVRINKSFHHLFNPPSEKFFVPKGKSRPITVRFNDKDFEAKYLHENPSKVVREMQSIRFSKELRNEFKSVLPDQAGYFSIKLGSSVNEFIFGVIESSDQESEESFAKEYIRQSLGKFGDADIGKYRRERLKKYNENRKPSKPKVTTRSVNESDSVLKELIKQLYNYKCQICSEQIKKIGWDKGLNLQQEFNYLSADAHHVVPLENNGLDSPSNIICVCPNCHRRLHTEELSIEFESDGPFCRNQVSGELLTMKIDSDHTFAIRTS